MQVENLESRESHKFNNSVALMLGGNEVRMHGAVPYWSTLTMVRSPDGLWSPIAGGVKAGENPNQAIMREAYEEGGLNKRDFVVNDCPTSVKTFFDQKGNPHLGLVYRGRHLTRLPENGRPVSGGETDYIKPFTIDQLIELIDHPSKVRFPELNLNLIEYWLRRYVRVKYGYEGLTLEEAVLESWGIN